ncbi:uncharacterized protein LOC110647800 [Hevea brasiliensis]|uniref:uncharacterized protein LOC110647800 n=1 Tax=Hevea brasiliensis TaxID=3981 RepID=UPI0025EEE4A9|nr:uncharacterized protein LOC110647800 [Hevea brasiliensis]XP_058003316.1 uncharacterized protein LOC110647800 [Hevea brasiliensis]XP_058003317.1 uncharacterized protein LOC110647800 [Hevea brasiliensis]XP_058003318.1 uncharacterized protein LOC110647800 [Hevea brasiliensis]XP_058003319.1 uncharacterized protein LOC110647800 [Hevea brasiliensis]XP_058003321.1 uncharacterized protein LOC110647800 [Hevea brasiliensis]XP_058003322.1 uncharacterized protein LOC110647800 [Hevea brasiliensis]XP_0
MLDRSPSISNLSLLFVTPLISILDGNNITGRFFVAILYFWHTSIGGKGSTEFVVKGSHKNVPQELIDELRVICQVALANGDVVKSQDAFLGSKKCCRVAMCNFPTIKDAASVAIATMLSRIQRHMHMSKHYQFRRLFLSTMARILFLQNSLKL